MGAQGFEGDDPPPYEGGEEEIPPPYPARSYQGFVVEREIGAADGGNAKKSLDYARSVNKSTWEFSGWGSTYNLDVKNDNLESVKSVDVSTHLNESQKLGQWRATSICGNDITSSCLYVAGLSAVPAGKYAPFALVMVAMVLYLFRTVYSEVCTALPLNGGAYNVLLNTTSKRASSAAACLTLLSYAATCVVSGAEAVHYVTNLIPLDHTWDQVLYFSLTVGLLLFFAVLNIMGISESANVAFVIFTMHIGTMAVLVVMCSVYAAKNPRIFNRNWSIDQGDEGDIASAIFFGFSAAMLGISGFESSANYVEEQKQGVFVKTLRNMWVLVAFFNPVISLLSLCVLPLNVIQHEHNNDLLAEMARIVGGRAMYIWVCVDAFLVLSGAVLTSYVGVTGLVKRMALDRCLPQFFLRENKLRRTKHWIILSYFMVCTSIFLACWGKIQTLASVYNISFLSVMALFAVGDMLLKLKRASLITSIDKKLRSNWFCVILAFFSVTCALGGNIVLNYKDLVVFVGYVSVVFLVVMLMLLRVAILRWVLSTMEYLLGWMGWEGSALDRWLKEKVKLFTNNTCVFLVRRGEANNMKNVVKYVTKNEQARNLIFVHIVDGRDDGMESDEQESLRAIVHALDHLEVRMVIDLVFVKNCPQGFSPKSLDLIQQLYGVERNMIFIGTPSRDFKKKYNCEVSDFGGVRLIV